MLPYNITYTFSIADLRASIDEEVSKAAQRAVTNEGVSLYDTLKIYAKDRPEVERAISDAMDSVTLRFVDMAELEADASAYTLKIYAPDITEAQALLQKEISRFVTLKAVSDWFAKRYPDIGKYYADMADNALAKVVVAARTRVAPTR